MAGNIITLYLPNRLHKKLLEEYERTRKDTPKMTFNRFLCSKLDTSPNTRTFAQKHPSEWGPEDRDAFLQSLKEPHKETSR